jgi:hypothetical protein
MKKTPLRKYLGPFEAWSSRAYSTKSSIKMGKVIEFFCSRFPQSTTLQQFTVTETSDYIQYLVSLNFSRYKIRYHLWTLDIYWDYIERHHALRLWNPIKPYLKDWDEPKPSRNKKSPLTLEEFKRLIKAAGPELRTNLYRIAIGGKVKYRFSPRHTQTLFQRAVKAAELNRSFTLTQYRRAMKSGLWVIILKDYFDILMSDGQHNQPCDALTDEPESHCNTLAAIETSPIDVRPPVINNSDDAFSIGWVDDTNDTTQLEVW